MKRVSKTIKKRGQIVALLVAVYRISFKTWQHFSRRNRSSSETKSLTFELKNLVVAPADVTRHVKSNDMNVLYVCAVCCSEGK